MSSVMWFRRDLRMRDNPALLSALDDGPVTALFIIDPAIWSGAGSARRAWLAATPTCLRTPLGALRIVDHAAERLEALERYRVARG